MDVMRGGSIHFGLGCGGISAADVLVNRPAPVPVALADRLCQVRAPIAVLIGGRQAHLHVVGAVIDTGSVIVPVRIGKEACRLYLSDGFIDWLVQTLGLEGALTNEEPLQRALLLELASLDFIRELETHVGEDIRLGMDGEGEPLHGLDIAIEVDGETLPLRVEMTERLANNLADCLDRLQPPHPSDPFRIAVDLVIEAGSQDLSIEELASLRPGDVVMLATQRSVAVANGTLVAAVIRQANGVELAGPFYPRSARAMVGSLADLRSGTKGAYLVHMIAESARVTTTVGAIDALKPQQALPLSIFEETGVDIVIDNRRFGRGELIDIGAGMGVRIVSLLPNAADSQTS